MNADLFRRYSSLGFAFLYAALAMVFDSINPGVSFVFCFFATFLLGIWLDCAMTFRLNSAARKLVSKQDALLKLYKERIEVLEKRLDHKDDADWWKGN